VLVLQWGVEVSRHRLQDHRDETLIITITIMDRLEYSASSRSGEALRHLGRDPYFNCVLSSLFVGIRIHRFSISK
jgi:hypothetical protein